MLKIKNSLNVLEKDSGVNQEEVLNIENKIFEHIYRILKQNNYFYFLNDFSHYKLIEKNNNELYKKLKNKLDNQIKETGKLEPIFLDITRSSYFNWDLNKYDFELFIINKLLQQRENISSTY